jgi:hypothetical protein
MKKFLIIVLFVLMFPVFGYSDAEERQWPDDPAYVGITPETSDMLPIADTSNSNALETVTVQEIYDNISTTDNTLVVDETNDRVGIGTDSPQSLLHLSGTGALSSGLILGGGNSGIYESTEDQISIATDGSAFRWTFYKYGFYGSSGDGSAFISRSASDPAFSFSGDTDTGVGWADANELAFWTAGAERLRVGASGNVGIGTDSPAARLDVKADTNDGSTDVLSWRDSDGVTLGVIDSDGNVGVGTDSPGVLLQVNQIADGEGIKLYGYDDESDRYIDLSISSAGATIISSSNTLYLDGSSVQVLADFHPSGDLNKNLGASDRRWEAFYTANITDDGSNVGIGTTSPDGPLTVRYGTNDGTDAINFEDSDGTDVFTVDSDGVVADLKLGNTTHADQSGVIYKNEVRFFHDFSYGDNGTTTPAGKNIFIGEDSGNFTIGSTAATDVYGSYNVCAGYKSGYALTTGWGNSFFGNNAGADVTTGEGNAFIGYFSGANTTEGEYNLFIGSQTGVDNSSGSNNVFIGRRAGYENTTGDDNTYIGENSGGYEDDGTTPNRESDQCVLIGNDTRVLANGDSNEIVIGDSAIGLGSNSVVIGNDSIAKTALKGRVGIGTTEPDTILDANGAMTLRELSSDPSDPDEGSFAVWMSDGTGSGDDGDIMVKVTAGGSTKTITLIDFSAF